MSKHLVLQRQFQALSQQNQILRIKAKKITQIQSYVNILMQSSQSCQEELNRSNHQNKQLKNQLDRAMAQSLRLQQNYQNQFKSLEAQFRRQLLKKDEDLRVLASNREKEAQLFQQKLSQSQSRSRNDLQRLKLQFLSMEKEYEQQIRKLTSIITQKSRDLELSEESKNQLKKAYLEQSNNISTEISKLQRVYHDSQNEVFMLKEELGRLAKVLDEVSGSENSLRRQISRKEDEFLADRRSYEKKIRLLQQNLNQTIAKQKKTQQKLNEFSIDNQRLKKQLTSFSDQNNDLKLHISKLERLINQKDQQVKQLVMKMQQQEEEHKRLLKRHNEQLKRVQQQLSLASERFLCQKRNSDAMKGEIQDLLKVIDKLEANLAESEHNLEMVNKENSVLFKEVENISKELKFRISELNDIDEKYKQARENSLMLEEMYKKESLKSQTLNKQNAQIISRLESITRQQKSLQKQQLSHLIEKHLAEKRDLLETHRIEKQNLAKKFQQALREKDEQARKRLQLLEDQINLMRIRH